MIATVSPVASALNVVSTTSVLWDPIQYIGGEKVQAVYIADPTICPHMQADIIPNRIQMQKDFIRNADLFVAINGTVDKPYVMPYVDDFMKANNYGTVNWTTLKNPSMTWNTPADAANLSKEAAGWLIAADPANTSYYETRLAAYLDQINAADLTPAERSVIGGQDAVVMVWQRGAAEDWLGLDVVTIFAPDFFEGGKYTPVKVVDDIRSNPDRYQNVSYVIENMQSGELAKGIEEYMNGQGINAKRVVFTNFPKSLPGVDSLPDVLRYNKGLVTPAAPSVPATSPAVTAGSTPVQTVPAHTTSAPLPVSIVIVAACAGCLLFFRSRNER